MYRYSRISLERLDTCHKDLILLFKEVIKHHDCKIITGHRDEEAQNSAYRKGHSETPWPTSKHNGLPSMAVDVMPYYSKRPHIRWDMSRRRNEREIYQFAGLVKGLAIMLDVRVRWGGDFKTFFDGAHWELVD